MSYFSAHNHTDYSNLRLLDSTNKIEDLIDRAIELKLTGLAITDHEILASHVKANKYRNHLVEKGIIDENFIIAFGDEIYLVDELVKNQKYYHFILIAKDQIGYEQLKRISSQAWQNSYYDRGMERVPVTLNQITKIIGEEKGHLIGSTACLGGKIPDALLQLEQKTMSLEEAQNEIRTFTDWCIDTFEKNNFYYELQAGNSYEQTIVNKMVKSIGDSKGIKCIITTDSHYLSKKDRSIHKAFLNSQAGEREVDAFYSFTYMMSIEEIKEIMTNHLSEKEIDECLDNTNLIAQSCQNIELEQSVDITKAPVEEFEFNDITKEKFKEYKYISKYLNSQDKYNRALIHYTLKGMKEKEDVKETKEVFDRIEIELEHVDGTSIRIEKNLANYLLTARFLVELMWTEGDSLVGPARGSATGFMINYLIDITQVNPMKWNLPWWRSTIE